MDPRGASPSGFLSKRHSSLPDGDLALAVALGAGRLAGGGRDDQIEQRPLRSSMAAPVRSVPASKSIQRGFACASALLLEIFNVGAGNPSGVPRPW